MIDERRARMALSTVAEPGSPRLVTMVAQLGAAETWRRILAGEEGPVWRARAERTDPDALWRLTLGLRLRYIMPGDDEWPASLSDLEGVRVDGTGGAPLGLWVRGELSPTDASNGLAMVGARAATTYGEEVATELAAGTVEAGCVVISGGAHGIDAAAHRGALAGGGRTVAVLACGVDVAYPASHASLLERIAQQGALVSEVAPGTTPTRFRFLSRNRVVAALGRGTVIVEAGPRSGAKNTVNWAQQIGRLVMAVPGSVFSACSLTPHRLIRDAEATLVTSAAEIISLIRPLGQGALFDAAGEDREVDALTAEAARLLDAVPARGALTIGELGLLAGLTWVEAAGALAALEQAGLVVASGEGRYRLGPVRGSAATTASRPIRFIDDGAAP